jgi:hypothetical protein
MARVEILECFGERKRLVTFHRTRDRDIALDRALRLNFGRRASLHVDQGTSHGVGNDRVMYGQIGIPVRGQPRVLNMITGRVRVEVIA